MVLVDFGFPKNCYQELPLKSRNSHATEPGRMTFVAKPDYKSTSKPVLSILGSSSGGQIGTPGHRALITKHSTIKVLMKNDLWSLGIIVLEAVCTLPPTKAECLLFKQNLLNSVSDRIFQFFLAFLIRQHQPGSKGYNTLHQ